MSGTRSSSRTRSTSRGRRTSGAATATTAAPAPAPGRRSSASALVGNAGGAAVASSAVDIPAEAAADARSRMFAFQYENEPDDLDLCCPICFRVFVLPEKTACNHTFCSPCIRETLRKVGSKCPLCRAHVDADSLEPCRGLGQQLDRLIVVCAHTKEGCTFRGERGAYQSHLAECTFEAKWAAIDEAEAQARKAAVLEILVGNTHTPLNTKEKNNHEWLAFVRAADGDVSEIKHVVFHLHPTFRPKSVTVTAPPFQLRRWGWGTFTVFIEIHTKRGVVHHVEHDLSFSHPLSEAKLELRYDQPTRDWTETGY